MVVSVDKLSVILVVALHLCGPLRMYFGDSEEANAKESLFVSPTKCVAVSEL